MTARKRKASGEPLLNTVARKLGHAAGTFAKATQELTENLSAIPENVTAKVRESARVGAPVGRLLGAPRKRFAASLGRGPRPLQKAGSCRKANRLEGREPPVSRNNV